MGAFASTSRSPKLVGGGSAGAFCPFLRLGVAWKALRLEIRGLYWLVGVLACELNAVIVRRGRVWDVDCDRAWRRAREAVEEEMKLRDDIIEY